jgi:hypothetical protein
MPKTHRSVSRDIEAKAKGGKSKKQKQKEGIIEVQMRLSTYAVQTAHKVKTEPATRVVETIREAQPSLPR